MGNEVDEMICSAKKCIVPPELADSSRPLRNTCMLIFDAMERHGIDQLF
jgi:hypothetical protein